MAEAIRTNFDPIAGAASLALFSNAPAGRLAFLSGQHLRDGLLSTLASAEIMAATAGLVPWFDAGNGEKGVAVLGGARDKLANAPESVRTIYLAAHGAARQAQAHARDVSSAPLLSQRVDGALAQVDQGVGVLPLAAVIVVSVIGVAAVVATAWFAKGVVERVVQTHGDDIRSAYAVDQAAKLATQQIAAGQQVDPGVWQVLQAAAKREQEAPLTAPLWIAGGVGLVVVGGLLFASWEPLKHAAQWGAMFVPSKMKRPDRGGRYSGIFSASRTPDEGA